MIGYLQLLIFFLNGYRRAWGTIMHQSRTLGRVIWLHLPDELTPSSGETSAADKDVSEYHPLITMNILPPSGIDRYGSVCYDAPILLLTRLTRLQYQRVKLSLMDQCLNLSDQSSYPGEENYDQSH